MSDPKETSNTTQDQGTSQTEETCCGGSVQESQSPTDLPINQCCGGASEAQPTVTPADAAAAANAANAAARQTRSQNGGGGG